MAAANKELLDLSGKSTKSSIFESLLVAGKESAVRSKGSTLPVDRAGEKRVPLTTAVPSSQVLGKVKDFLGVMAKANERLELKVQEISRTNYDIEVLDGNEQEYIEMDLLLGVADLHNAEAIAAAEAAIGNVQPSVASTGSSSSSTDDTDWDSDNDEDSSTSNLDKPQNSVTNKENSLGNNKPSKQPKIIMLD